MINVIGVNVMFKKKYILFLIFFFPFGYSLDLQNYANKLFFVIETKKIVDRENRNYKDIVKENIDNKHIIEIIKKICKMPLLAKRLTKRAVDAFLFDLLPFMEEKINIYDDMSSIDKKIVYSCNDLLDKIMEGSVLPNSESVKLLFYPIIFDLSNKLLLYDGNKNIEDVYEETLNLLFYNYESQKLATS